MTSVLRTRKAADPFEGRVEFTTYRNRAGTVISVRADCTDDGCWWHFEGFTRPIAAEVAGVHLATHGVVIKVGTRQATRRVMGTMSSSVPLDEAEENRAWFRTGIADLRARRRATARSGNPLARHLTTRR